MRELKGLATKSSTAGVEGLDHAILLAASGQEQEEDASRARLDAAQRAAQLEPVEAGHHPVGDHDLRVGLQRQLERLVAFVRDGHGMTGLDQLALEQLERHGVVVDGQDAQRGALGRRRGRQRCGASRAGWRARAPQRGPCPGPAPSSDIAATTRGRPARGCA
jgi:hypothetical protein